MSNPADASSVAFRWAALAALTFLAATQAAIAAPRHAIAMHGEPAYEAGFSHFRYANPGAPKGGRFSQGLLGSFDSLNPFVIRGNPFQQVRGYVTESLMTRGQDEPFTLYGLIAKSVETDDARTFVAFTIDPRARFSDGKPVTAEDVLFSWRILRDKGRPNHRLYYGKVVRAEKTAPDSIRFDFGSGGDRELPLILALMPVLPQHVVNADRFDEPSLTAPIGSGPYLIAEIRPGDLVVLKRNPNYWARDLNVNRGQYNFDELRFEFYRDATTWFEAFKRQLYDVRFENDPGRWANEYDFPAARSVKLIREEIGSGAPKPMSAFVFNMRRPIFADARTREALIELFDFEWMNAKLFFSAYARTASFFEGSTLSAAGIAASDAELSLLAPFKNDLRPNVLDGTYRPPISDASGRDRTRLRRAVELLRDAGWVSRNGVLVNAANGKPFRFEILIATRDDERIATVYADMLRRAGIIADVRFVDTVQFEQRRQKYEFDMTPATWAQSLSPGNEQYFYFGSASAGQPGTRNYMGLKSVAVDAMIDALLAAKTPEQFLTGTRALDRSLMSGMFVIPLYHLPKQWIARWPHIERPEITSLYGALPETWWRRQ